MVADIEVLYRAFCDECQWWGEVLEDREEAEMEMDEHSAESHEW